MESTVEIPDAAPSIPGWLADYEQSALARAHREMREIRQDRTGCPRELPPCIAHCLRDPNPHLLKPTGLQALTRVLLASGWEPSQIAGLVCARYEENHGWGDLWEKYEAAARARFYVRLFSGLVKTGVDREIDLNASATRKRGTAGGLSAASTLRTIKGKGWMEIGISTGVFYSKPIREVLPWIARAGFDAVELWTGDPRCRTPFDWREPAEIAAVRRSLRNLGLRATSFHAPYSTETDPSEPDPIHRKNTVALLIEAVRAAAAVEAQALVVHGSAAERAWVPEAERPARIESVRETLSLLHQEARAHGVAIAVETLLPHLLTADPHLLLELVKPYPKEEMGICFDTGHCFLWHSWPLERVYELLGDRVIALHVNDNRGVTDDHLAPGQGKIDWPRWLAALRRSAFSGVFLLEAVLPQETADPLSGLIALRQLTVGLLGHEPAWAGI
ncbi:sugar phosphate isomerase/epimerase [Verrucomicrobium sp. 3C]|uniref:sugar phosphate isomerase/epimerase family protein n=1 Tax=Verrucomicrobium sp. 3C TaxID=1134055 RepID=UPI0003692692|nr:sugar phosphate isomerase/epimerase family protein [Verrucomicrobium sp. 3C]